LADVATQDTAAIEAEALAILEDKCGVDRHIGTAIATAKKIEKELRLSGMNVSGISVRLHVFLFANESKQTDRQSASLQVIRIIQTS